MTLYREHYTEDRPNPVPEGWVWAGTDDEFGVLDRWMVPVEEPVYRFVNPLNANEDEATFFLDTMLRHRWLVEIGDTDAEM